MNRNQKIEVARHAVWTALAGAATGFGFALHTHWWVVAVLGIWFAICLNALFDSLLAPEPAKPQMQKVKESDGP